MHTIKLENFEGPLDLLLHLVEEKKMDIKNIKISAVIDEYLDIIRMHEKNNLKIKVQFLQMASLLIEIKAHSILKKDSSNEEEIKLETQLKEYKLYKKFSSMFSQNEDEYYKEYSKKGNQNFEAVIVEHDNNMLSLDNLQKCLNDLVLKLVSKKNAIKIEIDDEFTNVDAEKIINNIANNKKTAFSKLLKEKITKKRIVIMFIVILELYKQNKIDIIISDNDFYIIKGEKCLNQDL